MEDEELNKMGAESYNYKPKTQGGKIINRLESGENRDDNQIEKIPDAFAAEQTHITEDEIRQAQQRKGSYDSVD